jgi:hypothetical protein
VCVDVAAFDCVHVHERRFRNVTLCTSASQPHPRCMSCMVDGVIGSSLLHRRGRACPQLRHRWYYCSPPPPPRPSQTSASPRLDSSSHHSHTITRRRHTPSSCGHTCRPISCVTSSPSRAVHRRRSGAHHTYASEDARSADRAANDSHEHVQNNDVGTVSSAQCASPLSPFLPLLRSWRFAIDHPFTWLSLCAHAGWVVPSSVRSDRTLARSFFIDRYRTVRTYSRGYWSRRSWPGHAAGVLALAIPPSKVFYDWAAGEQRTVDQHVLISAASAPTYGLKVWKLDSYNPAAAGSGVECANEQHVWGNPLLAGEDAAATALLTRSTHSAPISRCTGAASTCTRRQ